MDDPNRSQHPSAPTATLTYADIINQLIQIFGSRVSLRVLKQFAFLNALMGTSSRSDGLTVTTLAYQITIPLAFRQGYPILLAAPEVLGCGFIRGRCVARFRHYQVQPDGGEDLVVNVPEQATNIEHKLPNVKQWTSRVMYFIVLRCKDQFVTIKFQVVRQTISRYQGLVRFQKDRSPRDTAKLLEISTAIIQQLANTPVTVDVSAVCPYHLLAPAPVPVPPAHPVVLTRDELFKNLRSVAQELHTSSQIYVRRVRTMPRDEELESIFRATADRTREILDILATIDNDDNNNVEPLPLPAPPVHVEEAPQEYHTVTAEEEGGLAQFPSDEDDERSFDTDAFLNEGFFEERDPIYQTSLCDTIIEDDFQKKRKRESDGPQDENKRRCTETDKPNIVLTNDPGMFPDPNPELVPANTFTPHLQPMNFNNGVIANQPPVPFPQQQWTNYMFPPLQQMGFNGMPPRSLYGIDEAPPQPFVLSSFDPPALRAPQGDNQPTDFNNNKFFR